MRWLCGFIALSLICLMGCDNPKLEMLVSGIATESMDLSADEDVALRIFCAQLRAGKAVDQTRISNRRTLHYCAMNNFDYLAGLVVYVGVNLDEPDEMGNTALHVAAQFENEKMLRLLLTNGASTLIKNKAGHTAIEMLPNDRLKHWFAPHMFKEQSGQSHH